MIKALFLDRDGIINIDHGYVYKKEHFEFVDGIFELSKFMQDSGYKIFIVTNQSGIARGYFSENQFLELMNWLIQKFLKQNIIITDYDYCKELNKNSPCRKPNPQMFINLINKYDIDINTSIAIGDKESDILGAYNSKIKTRYFVKSKYEVPNNTKATEVFSNLKSLINYIKNHK